MEGALGEGPCENCGRFVEATYGYGTVEIEPGLFADNVMRATCNQCGATVAIAGQSAHRLRKALDERALKKTTLRLPQELLDFVDFRLSLAGATTSQDSLFFQALLLACRNREAFISEHLLKVTDPVLSQPYRESIHINLGPHLTQVLEKLKAASGIPNASDILRRLVVLADSEILEIQSTGKARRTCLGRSLGCLGKKTPKVDPDP